MLYAPPCNAYWNVPCVRDRRTNALLTFARVARSWPLDASKLPVALTPLVNASDSRSTAWSTTGGDGDAASVGLGEGAADADGVGSACAVVAAPTKPKATARAAR